MKPLAYAPFFRAVARAAVLGLAVGTLVLGLGGRLLMRAIALATGGSEGFSVGGSLEVVAVGAFYGTVAGALLPCVPARLGPWRSVIHATGLFVLVALTSSAARGAASTLTFGHRLLSLLCFGVVLLAYSVLLIRLTKQLPAAGLRGTG